MNRFLIAIAILVTLVVLGIGAWMFFLHPYAAEPSSTDDASNPFYQDTQPYVIPKAKNTSESVQAAYIKQAGNVQIGKVAIVGDYALLTWSDDPMGGEALLKFNATQGDWAVVESIGGAYSVAGLNKLGVPQRTVLGLLDKLDIME